MIFTIAIILIGIAVGGLCISMFCFTIKELIQNISCRLWADAAIDVLMLIMLVGVALLITAPLVSN